MQEIGTVTVVAPSHERSAAAQSLTLRQPIYCDQIAENEYSIEGTPADAMIVALHTAEGKARPRRIRNQPRREYGRERLLFRNGGRGDGRAAINDRVPAIAVSIAHRGADFDFAVAGEFTQRLAPIVIKEGLPRGVLLNVNIPQPWKGKVQFTRQSSKITRNLLQPGTDPRGREDDEGNETEIHRADGAGNRSCGRSRRRDFDHTSYAGPYRHGFIESPLTLGEGTRRILSRLMRRAEDTTVKNSAVLLVSCADQRSLTAATADFIFQANGNVLHADEHYIASAINF